MYPLKDAQFQIKLPNEKSAKQMKTKKNNNE